MALGKIENRRWTNPKHLKYLNRVTTDVFNGKVDRVMIMMPPRHGKSQFSSHYFPAFYMGKKKSHDVIISSHTKSLAEMFGRESRDTMEQLGTAVYGVHVNPTNKSASDWSLLEGGRFFATGVGGSPIGRGAHLAIVDDPYGSKEDAFSDVIRESTWEWLTGTLRNRLEPNAALMLIMQRWHDDDVCGRLLKAQGEVKDGGRWTVIRLPAIAEDVEFWPGTDTVFRNPGDPLWPERYSLEMLEDIKQDLIEWEGEYFWDAQYQQRPQKLGGHMFREEWFQFFDLDEMNGIVTLMSNDGTEHRYRLSDCQKIVTVDPAFSENRDADWTVIQTWLITPNMDLLLKDQIREHVEGASIADRLRHLQRFESAQRQYVEAYGGGQVIAQQAREMGLPVLDLRVEGDKRIRAMPLQARMAAGRVYFRRHAPWFRPLRDEFLVFDQGRHDDQVDAAAYAAQVLAEQGGGQVTSIRRAIR